MYVRETILNRPSPQENILKQVWNHKIKENYIVKNYTLLRY